MRSIDLVMASSFRNKKDHSYFVHGPYLILPTYYHAQLQGLLDDFATLVPAGAELLSEARQTQAY